MLKKTIKSWNENDQPRERFASIGANALSDAELIAILLRTGTKDESAIEVSRNLIQYGQNNLSNISRFSINEIASIKGIGKVKAITILAALELGRRRQISDINPLEKIKSSKSAVSYFKPLLSDLPFEEFWILLLNRANVVIGKRKISMGGISGTVVDPKLIFNNALEAKASGLILCHNHPSGNTRPSEADIQLTKKIVQGGRHLEISILDHIIIAGNSFYSFADEGMLD